MRLRRLFPCILLLCLVAPLMAQANRGTAEATIKGKKISINYGRPSLKGRDLLSMASVGTVWRLGMNQATTIETAADLKVAGKDVKAGKYSLWAKKTGANSWVLAFHPTLPPWGVPELKEGYIAELPLKSETAGESAEQLTITVADDHGKAAIKIHWGTLALAGSVGVQ
jgi:Protein of unknown function (DUF2911)